MDPWTRQHVLNNTPGGRARFLARVISDHPGRSR